MSYVKRKKQPHLFRSNPYPTAEQVLAGVVEGATEKMVNKATAYVTGKILGRDDSAHVEVRSNVAKVAPRKRKPKAKKPATVAATK